MAQSNIKVAVQKFGNFLSSMVMPNISAFIAWGLITALFIPTGFFPNESLAKMVDPMVTYLLPLLIAYTGGKLVHDQRGAVVGAIATMGVIVGTDIPMFLGAMIMGPLGGYVIKKFDKLIEGKVKAGFEMLVNNFSAGILGGILAILAFLAIGPAVKGLTGLLVDGVDWLVGTGLLPLTSIIIEPAKVLFLNNAINHGVLSPIGVEQVKDAGKSVLFLLEANPGPGIGVLLAYCIFGKGTAKRSAPGAAIIQFFGGIHEIYFPYILMKPMLFFAVIIGGVSGVFTLVLLGGGLFAPASPGSILAIAAVTPHTAGSYIANFAGVLVAGVVSFLLSALILKTGKQTEENIEDAARKMEEMKGKKSSVADVFASQPGEFPENVQKIVFACDAGMGSSAMGASLLRKKVNEAGLDISVTNTAISNLPSDAQIVVTQEELTPRAQNKLPQAFHVSVDNFLSSPEYDQLIERLKGDGKDNLQEIVEDAEEAVPGPEDNENTDNDLLLEENVFLNQSFVNKEEAIRFAGRALYNAGYVKESYIEAMIARDQLTSTFMGNDVAIPHGTEEAKKDVLKSGFTVIQVPNGVDFDGNNVRLIFGIAGKDGTHLEILSGIAVTCSEMDNIEKMVEAKSAKEIIDILNNKE
ncbi:PTS mannitol transporter subunit IICBA [Heyndrickxia oleronia]|jgi:PTS system mannitol-specific IIC component|uniref:Mannitol-specific phosphotransferase enzyme IIA component n=1 Tax=Heyndrickxia oleronia TaxID=38875 RepID=A0A8E2I7W5_9BACI|nr:PTS mannitol transporter subunit IICBA [Heyndrickxia oleronia]OJH18373.1 PTS mannitol transporter subunit IICBA [Bacillus obstructivus]MBU5213376.1 PTS mannitol transporter subunit IICBA [Heyndrickxia oleronia]MCI1589972.1 PTS mannitol transporter subunit IICBA [Heyndrickxia oleronia]MCI1613402.1 PTS mannitol transporter subunit IICBA [Heyndrickxia oleronia]MCI1744690.1 PTS mannitol transporter subunit IICBA [Heyndrickxia oleronia]